MTDQEINARCATLAGIPAGQPFDAINNEDDLAKVIVANPSALDLSALTEAAQREAGAGEYQAAFRRAAAAAYAALPAAPQNVRVLT